MTINPRHNKFLDYYFGDGNMKATASYLLAYPDATLASAQSSGSDLVKKLKPEIERRMELAAARHDIKKDELIGHLQKMIEDCIKDGDRPNMIKALNMLARMGGHLDVDDTKISSGNINISLNLEPKNDNTNDNHIIL